MASSTSFRTAIVLLGLGGLSGCQIYRGQQKGEDGALGFYEPNRYPADKAASGIGFERPIALGARADAWVLAPGVSSFTSATVDNPEIVSLSLPVYPIVLRGLAEGTTTLRVSTSSASDSLPLTVVRPDGARLWVPEAEVIFAVPDSFFGKGRALRPGAKLLVAGEPLAGGRPLLGFDLFEWSIDPALLAASAGGSEVNTLRVTGLGASGMAQISTQFGGSVDVATLSASDAITLKIYRTLPSPRIQITALEPTDVAAFLLGANDAGGRTVIQGPADDAKFEGEITSGTVTILEAKLSGHYVTLRACVGTGTVRLRYLGAELSLPIEVTAAVADKACP